MTVRELAKLARHIIQTYPEFYKLFGEREFTWNKIRQQNRNPLLTSLDRRRRAEDRLSPRKAATAWSARRCRTACG